MDKKTPREKFTNRLLDIVSDFEKETGVEIHSIDFPMRIHTDVIGEFGIKSRIAEIEFKLK